MKKIFPVIFLFVFTSISLPQQFALKGKVIDKLTSTPLSFANIRIIGTTSGTAANHEGNFELRLKPGNYRLIASFIGYKSDTISVELNSNKTVKFLLEQIPINLKEITVLPGENPALEIIRRAIVAKHERNDRLNSYEFRAYTKGLVKTTQDFSSRNNSISLSIGTQDTGKLKISGIIENESKGYFKKPDKYKDEILARKQSANTPSSINVLTGGRIIQNFYTDDIQFMGRPLPSPISDDALDYYDYLIEDTLALDRHNIFQIHVEPMKKSNPGFVGKIYIADSIFSLIKLDVNLNSAANPGRIFDRINIIQQFSSYDKNLYMPIDYRVFAEGNVLGLIKFGFELNTIFYDYKINTPISDDLFGMAIVKVLPDADKRDTTYWKSTQTIPTTDEERKAYKRIDSLETVPRTFWDNFSFLSTTLNVTDNLSITGPLSLYSFNRIEGHTLNFGADLSQALDKRFNSSLNFSYGFADKKFKTDFTSRYFLGEYRTDLIYFRAYDKLIDLFSESIHYNKLTSTLTNLLGKYDFRDYYYTKGFSFAVQSEVFSVLQLSAGFFNRTDKNGYNNSDFSILNTSKTLSANKLIYETKINALTTGFQLDFRKFIEDGYFRRRTGQGKFSAIFTGTATFSNSSFNSNLNFELYKLTLNGFIPTFKSASMNFILSGIYSNGPVPFQMMYSLPGNIESVSQSFTMRTLSTGEVFGDRVLVLSIEHNFNDEIFRMLNISFLSDLQLNLNLHFNAAILEISPNSKNIFPAQLQSATPVSFIEFTHPFYEIGFGIGQALLPFRLEFTWKLNYFNGNNFVIGINSVLL